MRVVLCNGVFDPLHVGHVRHFQQAKKFGDRLIVSVTHDDSVRKERGESRPIFTHSERAEVIKALFVVDGVVIVKNASEALETVRPNVFVKGPDYLGKINPEHEDYCKKNRIEIRFTDGQKYSSTSLLNRLAVVHRGEAIVHK